LDTEKKIVGEWKGVREQSFSPHDAVNRFAGTAANGTHSICFGGGLWKTLEALRLSLLEVFLRGKKKKKERREDKIRGIK
jgi:hypothetical protein